MIHAHFETIHPFLDGNGRIGRLLIAALLEHWGLLSEPLMCLSGYLKKHQAEYYRRLSAIHTEGDWESWLTFFLEGVATAAVKVLEDLGIVTELTCQKKNRIHNYQAYAEFKLFRADRLLKAFRNREVERLETCMARGAIRANR